MRRRERRAALLAVLALALGLRLGHWWAVADDPFFARLAMDSQEYDRWAQEVAAGDWVGSEAFFQAPLYPYLLATVYRLAGRHLDLVYLLQIVLAVAGCWALWRAGRLLGGAENGERVGLAAAALAAVYGPFLFYDVQLLKESLAVTGICFLLWALTAARGSLRPAPWALAGLLTGIVALLRENMLLVTPLLLALAVWEGAKGLRGKGAAGDSAGGARGRSWQPFLPAAAYLAAFLAALAPVTVRNGLVAGSWLPTTFQGGVNFYIGNNPEADGRYRPIVPGKQIPFYERREPIRIAEADLGRALSASEVSRYWLGKALAWGRAEPAAFLRLQVEKLSLFFDWYEEPDAVDYYYVRTTSPVLGLPLAEFGGVTLLALAGLGLALARGRLSAYVPVLVLAAGWTASTVVFFLFSRYRLPVVPALILLAALPLAELARALAERRWRPAAGYGALALVAWLAPHAMGYRPIPELTYYNLGRIYDEAGDAEQAVAHYRAAWEADPGELLPALNLGAHAARAGRYREAAAWFERAVTAEPRSDDAWSNLGAARLALRQPAAARTAFDRALAIDAANPKALHNLALLELGEGRIEVAAELNRRHLAVEPESPQALRLAARIERARTEGTD